MSKNILLITPDSPHQGVTWHRCAMLLGAGLCGAGRAHAAAGAAANAGPGRAVTGGVHWGVRSACAGGVRTRPRRGLNCGVSAGGHRGARCCCAGGMRVRRSRCARRSGGLRPSSRRHARMLAGGVEGAACLCALCRSGTWVSHYTRVSIVQGSVAGD